jgi:hypothetical protein
MADGAATVPRASEAEPAVLNVRARPWGVCDLGEHFSLGGNPGIALAEGMGGRGSRDGVTWQPCRGTVACRDERGVHDRVGGDPASAGVVLPCKIEVTIVTMRRGGVAEPG